MPNGNVVQAVVAEQWVEKCLTPKSRPSVVKEDDKCLRRFQTLCPSALLEVPLGLSDLGYIRQVPFTVIFPLMIQEHQVGRRCPYREGSDYTGKIQDPWETEQQKWGAVQSHALRSLALRSRLRAQCLHGRVEMSDIHVDSFAEWEMSLPSASRLHWDGPGGIIFPSLCLDWEDLLGGFCLPPYYGAGMASQHHPSTFYLTNSLLLQQPRQQCSSCSGCLLGCFIKCFVILQCVRNLFG